MKPVAYLSFSALFATTLLLSGCGKPPSMTTEKPSKDIFTVEKGDLLVEVVDTGNLEASKEVEVKGRVGGRLKSLLVDEGSVVTAGQLIAVIDPQETQLAVDQQKAQLRGAQAGVTQRKIDLEKRRVTVQTNIERMKSKLKQLELELKNQPKLTEVSITSARTAYEGQQKAYDQLVNVTQKNTKVQVENAVADAKNNLANTQYEYDRKQSLLGKGYISEKDMQAADLSLQLAKTKLREAQERLGRFEEEQTIEREHQKKLVENAKAEYDRATTNSFQDTIKLEEYHQTQLQLRDAENDLRDIPNLAAAASQQAATVEQLQSSVADGTRQLNETQVKAPISGVIGKRYVEAGEIVNGVTSFSSGSPIVRVDDRSKLLVKLNINEIDVARMQIGQKASIIIDALPEKSFAGTVTKIAPSQITSTSADAVVKYQVEVTLNESDDKLKSGMSAKCTIRTVERLNVIKIPINFLGTDEKGPFVMIAPADPKDKKDKGTLTRVVTGVKSGTEVEIVSGLSAGTKIAQPTYKGPKRLGMMGPGGGDDE